MKLEMTKLGQAAALAGAAHSVAEAIYPVATRPRRTRPMPPPPPLLREQLGGFGGRQHRYMVHKGQQLRCFDPVDMRYLTFAHERFYLAWLLLRFDPNICALDAAPAPVAYRQTGRRFSARPDFKWLDAEGREVLCFLQRSWSYEQRRAHELFGVTRKVRVLLLTWDWLEESSVLLDNLEQARQVMTTAAFAGARLDCVAKAIYRHMEHHTQCARGELGGELSCEGCLECDEYLDATLFHLHAQGGILIDLSASEYGDDTVIFRC